MLCILFRGCSYKINNFQRTCCFYAGENAVEAGRYLAEDLQNSIFWLETFDLRSETDTDKVQEWYNTAGMVMDFLMTTYGSEAVMGVLDNLSTYPFNDHIENPDFYALCSRRLEGSFLKLLGKPSDALSLEYIAWMNKT